jgi:membrane protein YqaA with SNARE-associated domain
MHETAEEVVQSNSFRKSFTILGVFFILLTPFISLHPDTFVALSYPGVFIFNMLSSGLLILPALSQKLNIPLLVIASALGNIVNTSVNYFVGYTSNTLFSGHKNVMKVKYFLQRFGLYAVYFLAIAPFPLDINGLMSGYIGIPYKQYILVNFLGKLTLFLLVAGGFLLLFKH